MKTPVYIFIEHQMSQDGYAIIGETTKQTVLESVEHLTILIGKVPTDNGWSIFKYVNAKEEFPNLNL